MATACSFFNMDLTYQPIGMFIFGLNDEFGILGLYTFSLRDYY